MGYKNKEKQREYLKKHYNNNKLKYHGSTRKSRHKRRIWFINFKSKLYCQMCKEKFIACIEFHHIDPSKKEFSLSAFNQYGKKTIMKEFKKCIVLCSNCHNKIHFVRDEIFHIIKWIWF